MGLRNLAPLSPLCLSQPSNNRSRRAPTATGLTLDPARGVAAIELNQGDTKSGRIARSDVARVCVESIYRCVPVCVRVVAWACDPGARPVPRRNCFRGSLPPRQAWARPCPWARSIEESTRAWPREGVETAVREFWFVCCGGVAERRGST